MPDLVFMDFAATSARRPAAVSAAVASFLSDVGASVGRGGYRLASEAGRIALRCRQRVASILGVTGDPGRIAFMPNATYALNSALWGTVRRGDRIVVTQFDHNAVLRPAARISAERGAEVVLVPAHADGTLDSAALHNALRGARIFCINAASNVLGTTLDVSAMCALAREAGALSLVDAAQAAGHVPFDGSGADMIAFTGHKGLLGPPGIGGLWVRPGVDIDPVFTGGTGGDSSRREMPDALPDRLEAGTLNGAGIAGLLAGAEHVLQDGVAGLHQRLAPLKLRLHAGLEAVPGIRVVSPPAPDGVPIVSIVCDRIDPGTFAGRLDREHGVLVRAGLHCAPEAHRVVGTADTGAVRFSLGWCSTAADVERAISAVTAIAATPGVPGANWNSPE